MFSAALPYLIVCPLTFLAGFVDAVAGGGGLISLPAYMIAGLPVHCAIGTNKLSSGMGTALAVYLVHGKVLLLLGLAAGACSLFGNYIGISFFENKGSRAVKPIMLGVPALFFVRVLTEILST